MPRSSSDSGTHKITNVNDRSQLHFVQPLLSINLIHPPHWRAVGNEPWGLRPVRNSALPTAKA